MRSLEMTIAEGFYDSFTKSSAANETNRKMWVFDVTIFLSPIKKEYLEPLKSPDVRQGALDKPMDGELLASNFMDISDRAKFIDALLIWQKHRDSLDSRNLKDSIAIVVKFKYLGTQFYIVPCTISPQVLADVKMRRTLAKIARRDFPGPVRYIDRWLRKLKDSKGKRAVCSMGDRDKGWLLVWAIGRGLDINVKVANRFGL
ncbi:hypothetical protein GALMADRAFT_272030 [Galerina marginata CBS 339.88]|uniref:Uncharacterized protein n=1 Tax=Galerina marginata (strain CBS 339.88) TaxID=685588 RepID=A0A067SHJ7_GALM3|nr:hypothetical protein GALMADRAFT_272030 [Galerina marginata CBS 339.88]